MTNLRFKWALLVVVLAIAGYYLLPTIRFYRLPATEQKSSDPSVADIRENALRLGLDLKGGSYLVYEVDLSKIPEEQRKGDEIDRAIEVIRNRVDQYGVTEPVIQKSGENRIVVQLPGFDDPASVKELIGKTARLDFRLVKTGDELAQALSVVDKAVIRRNLGKAGSDAAPDVMSDSLSVAAAAGADSLMAQADTLAPGDSISLAQKPETPSIPEDRPFSSLLQQVPGARSGLAFVPATNYDAVKAMWEAVCFDTTRNEARVLAGNAVLLFGNQDVGVGGPNPGRYLYALSGRPELTGAYIEDAVVAFGLEPQRPQAAGVSLTLDRKGAGIFTRVTGDNVGKQLAIVLDNVVRSAPVIQDKIRGGRASITGMGGDNEAKMLGIVLRAGALPTDLNCIEERTVGPSLGKDSIEQGIRASILGALGVMLIMLIWYRASGILAIFALVLNIVFLVAVLGAIRGALTLPGLAGIVLTIGMAVDANVLIFERVREELRAGKNVRGAIEAGYGRALVTILDSNLTTLISSVVLFQFGTGPIRGFALTLMVGILANIFTAVFVTRLIYDSLMARRPLKGLSI